MKKRAATIFVIAGLLSVLLSGCRTGKEVPENTTEPVVGMETGESETEETAGMESGRDVENGGEDLPYQFARKYGIVQSEYPLYELDAVVEYEVPDKEMKVSLTFAVCQNRELIVGMVLDDYGEVKQIGPDENPPEDGRYLTMPDGTKIVYENYQSELWAAGEGLFLTGPGLPEDGIKPLESMYPAYPDYFMAYGNMRYLIEAKFELPSAPDQESGLSGYALQVLDFEKPVEFALKGAPEYASLEELAAAEHGSIAEHDGISIISMGERSEEGILVSWYVFSEAGDRSVSLTYKPPLQEVDLPVITGGERDYPIKELSANPFWDSAEAYRLSEVKGYGRRYRCMFDVPQAEQGTALQIHIPGITFLDSAESEPVTLPVPEDYEALNQDIHWKEGSVRILGITKMKEPQTVEKRDGAGNLKVIERPAVYIDVEAVHEEKDLALRGLICQRKLRWSGWEHERYDFDENGSLSGFRIFYEEGDTEVTLKFHGARFYWDQPFVMDLILAEQ